MHQEDVCQASGVFSRSKYEDDGGPSLATVARIIDAASRDGEGDRIRFAKATAFNLVAAGTDAHAKNYSLLHIGRTSLLAPLYDLISAHPIYHPKSALMRARLPMSIGGQHNLNYVNGAALAAAARDLQADEELFALLIEEVSEKLADAAATAIDELPAEFQEGVIMTLPQSLARAGAHFTAKAQQMPH